MSTSPLSIIPYIFSFELLLGGQARLTPYLTPGVHKRAMSKAKGYQEHMWFLPIRDPTLHSNVIGALMVSAGVLLLWSKTRVFGAGLGGLVAMAGVWAQSRMGVPFWLPCVNTVLAGLIVSGLGELLVWLVAASVY